MQKNSLQTLIIGFVLIITLMIIFSVTAFRESDALAELTTKMYRHPLTVSNAVLEANAAIIAMHRHMKDIALASNNEELEASISKVNSYEQRVFDRFEIIKERYLGEKTTIDAAFNAFLDWEQIRSEVIYHRRASHHVVASGITNGRGADHVQILTKRMDALIIFARNKAEEFLNHSKSKHQDSNRTLLILMVFGLSSGSWIAWFSVSQINQAQKKLLLSEQQTRTIIENVADGIIAINKHSIIELFSPAAEQVFGYRAEEVIGKNVTILMPEPMKSQHDACVASYLDDNKETRVNNSLETLGMRRDGSVFSIEISLAEAWLNQDKIFIGIIRDITERKKTENRLLLAKRVVENASEAIMVTDAQAIITDVNPAYEKISGFSREEALGNTPNITKSGRHGADFYEKMWQQLKVDGSWSGEIWDRRKSGEIFPKWLSMGVEISSQQPKSDSSYGHLRAFF
jgi:PAS domain S-box-containing protein